MYSYTGYFVNFIFVDIFREFTVDFGSSLGNAVLKFYPAVDKTSTGPFVCLSFDVKLSSSAVRLQLSVSNMSEDNTHVTTRSDNDKHYLQQVDRGTHSVTVLRNQQYVVLTATKIRVTATPDRVTVKYSGTADRPCKTNTKRKLHYSTYRMPYF